MTRTLTITVEGTKITFDWGDFSVPEIYGLLHIAELRMRVTGVNQMCTDDKKALKDRTPAKTNK